MVLFCAPAAVMDTDSVLRVRTNAPNFAATPCVASSKVTAEIVGTMLSGTTSVNVVFFVPMSVPPM